MKTWWSTSNENPDFFKTYNKHSGVLGKKFITALLRENETVLDVGCGSGILYEQMRDVLKWEHVFYKGVDLTDEFVKACQEQYPGVAFEVQDMKKLQESDESFDTVVNYHAIEYSGPDFKKVLEEGLRVAKKRFIVALWKGLTQSEFSTHKLMADGVEYESQFSAREWFGAIRELGYSHAPWLELYTDEFRYNLVFVFDKQYHRIESLQGMDYLTQT